MARTGSNLPQAIGSLPADWPSLRSVVEARLPAHFFDHRPPRVRVLVRDRVPQGVGAAARAWNGRLQDTLDGLRAEWAAGAVRLAGRPDSETAALDVISLSHEARLRARLDWTRGTVVIHRGRMAPGGEWAPLAWFGVRVLVAPPAEATAATSRPPGATTAVLPASAPVSPRESVQATRTELERRWEAHEALCSGVGRQAAALRAWLHDKWPTASLPRAASIENAIRGRFKEMTAPE